MKKLVLTVFLILSSFFTVSGQEGPIDLILLLDTSSSMSASYREVNNYMTGAFLRDFLRSGDTFHLIPFGGSPRVDVSRRIEGRGDLETIIGRMLLQYPLEPWSDIAAALSYAENYASTLPARPKKVVLLSDGDASPQPGSASRPLDEAGLQSLIDSAKDRLRGRGISLDYVKVSPGSATPLANLPASGRPPRVLQAPPELPAAQPLSAAPSGVQPPVSGTETGPGFPGQGPGAPGGSGGYGEPGTTFPGGQGPDPWPGAFDPGTSPADAPGSETAPFDSGFPAGAGDGGFPEDGALPAGDGTDPAYGDGADTGPISPRPPARYDRSGPSLPIIIGLAALGLAVLALIIFLVTRRLQGTPNRVMAQAASRTADTSGEESAGQFSDHSAALANYAASQQQRRTGPYTHTYKPQNVDSYDGPLMLNLFVEDQNTFIGKRNIHAVKSGYSFTVGGGKSDFLIFLVPIPPHIGDVRCDGSRCTFTPRKPQYFPDIGSQQVPDCIGKTIRIISDKKYELHFRFERYEDPLKALNRLLHSVQVPG
jgi:hypothetical protein